VLGALVQTAPAMPPDAPDNRREERLPPPRLVPSAEISAEVSRARRLPDEERESRVPARLVEEAVDEARLLLLAQPGQPELVEVAPFDDAARGEMTACQRVADPSPKR